VKSNLIKEGKRKLFTGKKKQQQELGRELSLKRQKTLANK
jgi:hypothetical protein